MRNKKNASILIRLDDSEIEDINRILSHPAFKGFNNKTELIRHIIEKYIKKVHQIESGNYRDITVHLNVDTYETLKDMTSFTGEKISEFINRFLNDPDIWDNEIKKRLERIRNRELLEKEYINKKNEQIVSDKSNFNMEDYDL